MKKRNFINLFGKIVIVIVCFFLPTSAFAIQSYNVIDLGTLDGKFTRVTPIAINDIGQVVGLGFWKDSSNHSQAFLWDSINGMKDIGGFGENVANPYDINDQGQIVGGYLANGSRHAFLWENNIIYDLGSGWANGINNSGVVVGWGSPGAFMWDSINGRRNPFGSGEIRPNKINDFDQVVGYADNPSGYSQGFIWDTVNGLQFIDMPTALQATIGTDINNFSQISGHGDSVSEPHYHHSYVWEGTNVISTLGDLGGNQEWAFGINNNGQIVGNATAPNFMRYGVGFIWDEINGMQNVNDLILLKENFQYISSCVDINNAGQIVAQGIVDEENGNYHAFLLTPIPENQLPTADAGPDQTIECTGLEGTWVTLDGSGSSDPDSTPGTNDDIVSFKWYEAEFLIGDSEVLDYLFEVDTHPITLEVTDNYGETDSDLTNIIIQDTTPPSISVSVSPDILWPPNHKMVHVYTTVIATDNCDTEPAIELFSIVMNESDETITYDPNYDFSLNDGMTSGDIQIVDDFSFYLRCERSGKSDGRIYTITYSATDASGNESTAYAEVLVPHSM